MNKILVVDDDIRLANDMSTFLTDESYRVICKYNYTDAVEAFKREMPDLVILDIDLQDPLGDGVALAKEIKKSFSTPFIFLTGSELSKEDKNSLIEVTNYPYLKKPVDYDELLTNIKIALKSVDEVIELHDNCYFNITKSILYINNTPQPLSQKEKSFLKLLVSNRNSAVTFRVFNFELFELENHNENDGQLRNFISRFKRKYECLNIQNTPNVGYMLAL